MKRRVRQGFCALLVSICCVPTASAQERSATWNDRVQMVVASPIRDAANVALLRATATELAIVSPTFRQMLEALNAAPHVNLRATPVAGPRSLGRGYFSVAGGFTMGLMEISVFRGNSHLQVRAVAHELAHAAEIACLPRQSDTEALQRLLLDRSGRVTKGHGIETPFARAAEDIVLREYLGHGRVGIQLPYLAMTYELPLCQEGFRASPVLRAELSQVVR